MNKFILAFCMGLSSPAFAGFGDSIAKAIFQNKVEEVYQQASQCAPLEIDSQSQLDVTDWMKMQPQLPEWTKLAEIESTAEDSSRYALSLGGNDKHLHCLAGCYIAKKLDYTSAVLVGWIKELRDASDCSLSTRFEKMDYEATVWGAEAADSKKDCSILCKNK